MDFTAFDTSKIEEYSKEAKKQWGDTAEYKEFERKSKNRSKEDNKLLNDRFMLLFKEAGKIRESGYAPDSEEAQDIVNKIQSFITENMYTCSDEILLNLGKAYSAGGEFTKNIDACGGPGTGEFVDKAIQIHCGK